MAEKTPKPQRARKRAAKTGKPQAESPSASRRVRTRASDAGKPKKGPGAAARAPAPPSDAELDRRDQMKSGPRRQAGPPLEGIHPEPEPLAPLADELMPDPTDPSE